MGARRRIEGLALYHFEGCPYCSRVQSALARLGVEVEQRDIQRDPARRAELVAATGKATVPCLRIAEAESARWLHESADIVRFLETRFSP